MFKTSLFALFLIFSACSNKQNEDSKKVFRYNESKGIATLDPAYARNQTIMWPVSQIFNGLVQLDDSLIVQPCIAHSWEILDNGIHYRFVLRSDVNFHPHNQFKNGKGRKVVASDFVYSFGRILDDKISSPGRWIFNMVDQSKVGTINGFVADNDSVLSIYLKQAFPAFLGLLTTQYCSVVPKEIVTYYGNDFRKNPIGTGPFLFKIWVENEKLVLVKNPEYFETDKEGKRFPFLDAVNISFIADLQSEFLEFLKGRLDFIKGVNASFKDELILPNGSQNPIHQDKFTMLKCPYLNTEYLGFLVDTSNMLVQHSPILDVRVRQAINYGINRVKMMAYLRNNIGHPATNGFIPIGLPNYNNKRIRGYEYNPAKSLELLKDAGFPNGKGLQAITITTTADYLDLCEFIQHELKNIGININIEVVTGVANRELIANSKVACFRGSWVADYPEPENYFSLFYSKNFAPSGPNYTHYKKEQFDQLYLKSFTELQLQKRYRIYQQMDSIIMKDAVVVPLYYDEAIRFINKNVSGLGINPINQLVLKGVEK